MHQNLIQDKRVTTIGKPFNHATFDMLKQGGRKKYCERPLGILQLLLRQAVSAAAHPPPLGGNTAVPKRPRGRVSRSWPRNGLPRAAYIVGGGSPYLRSFVSFSGPGSIGPGPQHQAKAWKPITRVGRSDGNALDSSPHTRAEAWYAATGGQ